ncbi:MAG: lipoate--protein ligase [Firmicutes bacterium]|nr:lipoate--protein ligase [Bacillota bacterium]
MNGVGQIILYLWQNQNTVVIGKNQNAWQECHWQLLETEGGRLARRQSGGGAVYHDLGNLNFSFIMDRNLYNVASQLQIILKAVSRLGVEAEFSGRNDLTAQGCKFSGNAFHLTAQAALHHGTILVSSDLARMSRYLQVSSEKFQSKGIDSVQSRVTNLSALEATVTVPALIRALEVSFTQRWGESSLQFPLELGAPEMETLYQKNASWEWRYGKTPNFTLTLTKQFTWGRLEWGLRLEKGMVADSVLYSDALEYELIASLSHSLTGLPFRRQDILKTITHLPSSQNDQIIVKDIYQWIEGLKL